ncbi:fibronectin type III domain-containing protein [Bifidobacterium samirii]|uniref:Fibronectin type-III domain-containing protein n=1 Tax=Bifidobacterium samirii TaxID=2306974 RepID=A0A430FJS5_9BIFI|nr:fibronectin type III domain-containing protein [Bifidobacterium samirii]RSX53032.1 hypothetical protein D2E24_1703 [Bifidobacterium samirii]
MADGYGNIVNNAWRCWCAAWVVSETDTTATIRVEARQQTVNGWTLVGWASASVYCDGQTAGGNSASQTIPTNGYATRYSRDFTVSKTSSSRNVWCSASVSWNGTGAGSSNAGVNVAIVGIRYKKPNTPSDLSITRVDDTAANLTWRNNPDAGALKPYAQVIIDKRTLTGGGSWGAWGTLATLGGTTTNYKAALKSNCRYQFRILARNTAGDSAHVETQIISTTPAAPKSVTAVKTGTGTVAITADVSNSTPSWVTCWRTSDGGKTWTSLTKTVADAVIPSNGKAIITDTAAPAGTIQYRCYVRRRIIGDGKIDDLTQTLVSSTATVSNAVTTITPPLAPTVTTPQAGAVYANPATVRVQWTANHPDGSAQTAAQVEATDPDGGTRTGDVTSADHYDLWCATSGQWSVRVRTKGLHADWGAWSTPVAATIHYPPTVVITAPSDDITASPFDVSWSVSDRTGVSEQTVTISGDRGQATLTVPPTESGVTVTAGDYLPANGERVTISVRVRGGSGLTGTASILRTVTYTPPAAPSITITIDHTDLSAVYRVDTGEASGTTPKTDHILVRRIIDDDILVMADALAPGQQTIDRLPPLRLPYTVEAIAFAASGATSSSVETVTIDTDRCCLNFGPDAAEPLPVGGGLQISEKPVTATEEYHFANGDDGLPYSYQLHDLDNTVSVTSRYDWQDGDLYRTIRRLSRRYAYAWFRNLDGSRIRAKTSISQKLSAEGPLVDLTIDLTEINWKEPS